MFFKQNEEKFIFQKCTILQIIFAVVIYSLKMYRMYEHFTFSCLVINEKREDSGQVLDIEHCCMAIIKNGYSSASAGIQCPSPIELNKWND
jgi:hypothetical protein